jgi:glutamine synthetase
MFDGSSIAGWKGINESDMILMPDDETSLLDPFTDDATVILRCDIIEPSTMQGYERDPRSVAKRAEEYLTSTGLGDTAFFGPEPEFFVFDDVKWHSDISGAGYTINSEEAAWSSNHHYDDGNTGHRPGVKGGYFPSTTRGFPARYPRSDVFRHGANGPANRGTPPRSRNRRTV